MLALESYRDALQLDVPFEPEPAVDGDEYPQLVRALLEHLIAERGRGEIIPDGVGEQRKYLRALLTLRPAEPFEAQRGQQLGALFHYELQRRGQVDIAGLPRVSGQFPGCRYPVSERTILWQGDICLLNSGAITNAANSALQGCFQPFHRCIDNVIHSGAGPRLREDCALLMRWQGRPEATGHAKLTRAYYLPSRYVVHTVGPIVRSGRPSAQQRKELASCYLSCLDVCEQMGSIESLTLCCISTGVFGYPQGPAAQVALQTIAEWCQEHPRARLRTIIFNVFRDEDLVVYQKALQQWPANENEA